MEVSRHLLRARKGEDPVTNEIPIHVAPIPHAIERALAMLEDDLRVMGAGKQGDKAAALRLAVKTYFEGVNRVESQLRKTVDDLMPDRLD